VIHGPKILGKEVFKETKAFDNFVYDLLGKVKEDRKRKVPRHLFGLFGVFEGFD